MIEVKNLGLKFGKKCILKDISFSLPAGEIGCLLGPSGSGKTTLLRALAGLEKPYTGRIRIYGQQVYADNLFISPERRQVGMVFQDYALFPHLTVEENLKLGIAKLPSTEIKKRVDRFLELARLKDFRQSYPHEISGGQQQRVALMRALIRYPSLILLDEPFSSLDVHLSIQLANDIRHLLQELKITALVVTHDQQEALILADKIGVLYEGQLLQWSSGYELYHFPTHPFVASFVGEGPFIQGEVLGSMQISSALGIHPCDVPHTFSAGEKIKILIRPDDILHDDLSPFKAQIIHRQFRGAHYLYTLQLPNGESILSLVPGHHEVHNLGEKIGIRLDMGHVVFFKF